MRGLPNIRPPLRIDLTDPAWCPTMQDGSGPAELLAVFCANVIHIAPWRVAEGLFAGAARYLRRDGRLFLYGPFKRDGKHTALSNAVFDTSLRERDPEWGVRDIADVEKLADGGRPRFGRNRANAGQQFDSGVRAIRRLGVATYHVSILGEAPPRSAKPAALLSNVLVSIQSRDLLPAAMREGFGQRSFGHLVAASAQGKIATGEIHRAR